MSSERMKSSSEIEQAIFMIKPDGQKREVAGFPLPQLISGLLLATDLIIREQSRTLLDEEEIRQIYPVLNQPSDFGEQWKLDVIQALQAAPLQALLIEGVQAENKAKTIRRYLREKLTDRTTEHGKIVENLAHVSDSEDFDITYQVLFKP